MIVEGKGNITPLSKRYLVSDCERRAIYNFARGLHRYDASATGWKAGFLQDICIPGFAPLVKQQATTFVGKMGEAAVRGLARQNLGNAIPPLDLELKHAGDGGVDLNIFGLSMQVKTRVKQRSVNLIRVVDARGNDQPLHGDIHVFCEWLDSGSMVVTVLGWMWTQSMLDYVIKPAWRGEHQNIEVPDADLQCLSRLWAELEARREAA